MKEEKYVAMLEELIDKLPDEVSEESRFSIPTPSVIFEGRRTIIVNFKQMATTLDRNIRVMTSFFGKEIAAPAVYDEPRLIIQAKVDRRTMGAVIRKFVKKYVICPACKGPDTKLTRKRRILTIKCEICGTETPVEAI